MLRITEASASPSEAVLRLEGRVTGVWVAEAEKACDKVLKTGSRLTLDLADVAFVDRGGIALFQELSARGVTISNCSPFVADQLGRLLRSPDSSESDEVDS